MTLTYNPLTTLLRYLLATIAAVVATFLIFFGMVKLIELNRSGPPASHGIDIGEFTKIKLPPPPPPRDESIQRPPPMMSAPPQISAPVAELGGGIPSGFAASFGDADFNLGNAFDVSKNIGKAGIGDSGLVLQTPLNPNYPSDASRRGVEGYVKLKIHVNEQGRVDRVEVVQGQPVGIFDQAAIDAAKNVRYKPKMVNGQPVASVDKRKLNFKLDR